LRKKSQVFQPGCCFCFSIVLTYGAVAVHVGDGLAAVLAVGGLALVAVAGIVVLAAGSSVVLGDNNHIAAG